MWVKKALPPPLPPASPPPQKLAGDRPQNRRAPSRRLDRYRGTLNPRPGLHVLLAAELQCVGGRGNGTWYTIPRSLFVGLWSCVSSPFFFSALSPVAFFPRAVAVSRAWMVNTSQRRVSPTALHATRSQYALRNRLCGTPRSPFTLRRAISSQARMGVPGRLARQEIRKLRDRPHGAHESKLRV